MQELYPIIWEISFEICSPNILGPVLQFYFITRTVIIIIIIITIII